LPPDTFLGRLIISPRDRSSRHRSLEHAVGEAVEQCRACEAREARFRFNISILAAMAQINGEAFTVVNTLDVHMKVYQNRLRWVSSPCTPGITGAVESICPEGTSLFAWHPRSDVGLIGRMQETALPTLFFDVNVLNCSAPPRLRELDDEPSRAFSWQIVPRWISVYAAADGNDSRLSVRLNIRFYFFSRFGHGKKS